MAPKKATAKKKTSPRKKSVRTRKSLHRAYSSQVTETVERAPSRAMLHAVGFTDKDFKKSQIGIAGTWSMVTPCNMHIDGLAKEAVA
ncbi:MAG: dihydroxy-acid dehydratase, partial [Candidatus Hydrogenedentes bacterium]|nr:dihydroxy-acid dehydratase [Candidatus Hydrogenedentota bacterium]